MKSEKTNWKQWADKLKQDTYALYLAYRHPQTPWYAKVWTACVVAYALSPIDLIPDFIPVLGYLDDLILIPAGLAIAVKLIPPEVMAECQAQAKLSMEENTSSHWIAGLVVVGIWILLLLPLVLLIF
jgi:uncharacterized membrane protein YkvA (DUF1232 family)